MTKTAVQSGSPVKKDESRLERAWKNIKRCKWLYLMLLPALAWYLIFCYQPMYGAQIAFKQFNPAQGITGSPWVGFRYFQQFFRSPYLGRLIRNTLGISLYDIIVGFPAPILLALLINEVQQKYVQKVVQTVVYLPHFISTVVISGMILAFLAPNTGIVNSLITSFGGESVHFMAKPEYFKTVFVLSGVWQGAGWGSIIYLAALTGIDPSLYEAAIVDGATKFQRLIRITLPCIAPTIMIMLILRMGSVFSVGYEKIILLYNDATMETADVISSYVYRRGIQGGEFSFSTAVGLFNSLINFIVIITFNKISRKFSEVSLW